MNDEALLVNLNTADLDELQKVPGVGPAMAERILAARPFTSIEDLHRVSGIGPSVIDRMRPYLSPPEEIGEPAPVEFQETETGIEAESIPAEIAEEESTEAELQMEEPEGEIAEAEIEIGEPAEMEIPEIQAEAAKPAPVPAAADSKAVTREQAIAVAFLVGFLALLLAIALNLGFLAMINGGLRYANPAQVEGLRRQVEGLNSQAEILQQDLGGLRTRVDKLEGLSGRVAEVEKVASQLRGEMDEATASIEQLSTTVAELSTTVEELQARTGRFENFLASLRELLNGLFGSK